MKLQFPSRRLFLQSIAAIGSATFFKKHMTEPYRPVQSSTDDALKFYIVGGWVVTEQDLKASSTGIK